MSVSGCGRSKDGIRCSGCMVREPEVHDRLMSPIIYHLKKDRHRNWIVSRPESVHCKTNSSPVKSLKLRRKIPGDCEVRQSIQRRKIGPIGEPDRGVNIFMRVVQAVEYQSGFP